MLQQYMGILRVSHFHYATELCSVFEIRVFKVEHVCEKGLSFLSGQPTFVPFIVPLVKLLDVLHALLATILARPLHSPLVIVENHTQKYIHKEEDSKHDE